MEKRPETNFEDFENSEELENTDDFENFDDEDSDDSDIFDILDDDIDDFEDSDIFDDFDDDDDSDYIKAGTTFEELMFSELRLVSFKESDSEIDENNLVKAMTVNEELINMGYALSPKDIIRLSTSESLCGFAEQVRNLIGDVKAQPMYPNFPSQVMELTEAQFRFHQILHYMSTYGMELIMGTPVEKGWLPEPDAPEKTEEDDRLLESKIIGLVSEDEMYINAIAKVTGKSERMTGKERFIVSQAVGFCTPEQLSALKVPFKQNLFELFYCIFADENLDRDGKLSALKSICPHSGDVWKCIDYTLTRNHYHFRTSQKKLFVKLLESYPIGNFRENLILSLKKAERIKVILPFISFDNLSRSFEHKKAVRDLRDGKLHSWTSRAVELIKTNPDEAVDYISKRPGELFRRINWLLKAGCSREKLVNAILESSEKLSIQTIVTTLNNYGNIIDNLNADLKCEIPDSDLGKIISAKIENLTNTAEIFRQVLAERLKTVTTGMEGKKVYCDFHSYDLDMSVINCNEKSDEGGYIRSGLALKLPENVDRLRFFVYWNHPTRVDVDLHASAIDKDGEEIHIGWSRDFKAGDGDIVFSGDITHSDAAEYIDFNLNSNIKQISANINIFSGVNTFRKLQEVYVGIMAVKKLAQNVKHYSSKNCFFSHYLTSNYRRINYGYIDVEKRVLIFDGSPTEGVYDRVIHNEPMFSLHDYLDILFKAKNIEITDNKDEADAVLVMEKASKDNEISLIDSNFFMN
ncbi:MAG: hypothetical protein NC340_08260 [Ruminococcus flavefaciens]|nr:hypothetical protein [Ruminococcus flavefaciens]MCM1229680.1 hypothetical protein [Ruminococcus flavefaciens]